MGSLTFIFLMLNAITCLVFPPGKYGEVDDQHQYYANQSLARGVILKKIIGPLSTGHLQILRY